MYLEHSVLEQFSAVPQTNIYSTTPSRQRHPVLNYFLSDDSKQDAAIITAHIKRLILLPKEKDVLTTSLSTIWGNTDGCDEQYKCASSLYLMSVMSQCYLVIIDLGISAPGNYKEVVDELNGVDKRYIYQFMSNVQLPGSYRFDSNMQIHTGNQNNGLILAKEFQQHLTKEHFAKMISLIRAKKVNNSWKIKKIVRQYHVK